MKKIKLNLIQIFLLIAIPSLFLSIISGALVYNRLYNNDGKVTKTNNKYVNEFIKTYNILLDEYFEDLDENKLVDSAINGMLDYTGDDYTIYLNEDATDALNDKLDGTYEGIGVRISLNDDNKIYIFEVFKDSPADKAGIKVDDILLSIDGNDLEGKTLEDTVNYIKNSKKKTFNIEVLRDGNKLNYNVERKVLLIPAITSSIKEINNKKIGYIYLETFSNSIDTQVETTLLSMEKEGIDSLIIDVRDNTGGYLSSCTNVIELFLRKGKVMYSIKSKKDNDVYKDDTSTHREYPIVVLINGNSASASEILASSLKYSYGATLVGTKTFGKGKVQTTGTLNDGTMIKYTTAKWYMPNGECIDEKGINPDINIELSDEYKNNPTSDLDNQLNEALRILSLN